MMPTNAQLRRESRMVNSLASVLILLPVYALSQTAPGVPTAPADRWPMYRGTHAMTGVSGSPLPEQPKLLWKVETKSSVDATAAIADGVVYIGTMDGQFFALRLSDGSELWKYANPAGDAIQSSACVGPTFVYYGDAAGTFRALERKTGNLGWEFKAEAEIISSPVLVDGRVVFGSYDGFLYCLDSTTGAQRWRFQTSGPVHCSPTLINGQAAVAGCDGFVRLVSIADGNQTHALELGGNIASTPAAAENSLFFGTMGNQVVRIDTAKMQTVWEYENPKQQFPFFGSPALTLDLVLIGGRDKLLHAIERRTGKGRWTFRTKGRVDSPPVVVGARAYFGSDDGSVYGVDIATGNKQWEYVAGAPVAAGPAAAAGKLVVGDQDGRIYCFGQ
jgi:outer membrane protein assembly factor BamB